MSEDDRAAKAARAKAMLNRRRQQKAGTPQAPGAEPSSSSVSQIPSRTHSPAPSERPSSERGRDLTELFSKGDSDPSWISSLPRAASTSERVAHGASQQTGYKVVNGKEHGELHRPQTDDLGPGRRKDTESKDQLRAELSRSQQIATQHEQERQRLESLLENERQTVSFLVSEKSNLAAEVHRLEEMESKAGEYERLLIDEQQKTNDFEARLTQLQSHYRAASDKLQGLETREKELNEKCRDQERQLQRSNGAIADLRTDLEGSRRRVKELEGQISSDDRVERLEESLKNTQDRADDLEFQLSKSRQSQTSLKAGYDELERQCHTLQKIESDLELKNADLQRECTKAAQALTRITSERDSLVSERTSLQTQLGKGDHSIQELRTMLDQASSELAIQTRQLQTLQNDLRVSTRRADEAEKTQKDLQLDGTNLMRALNEMRPKIVDLTSEKLNLTEKVESLQHALRNTEATVDELTSSLEDAHSQVNHTNEQWQQKWAQRDKEHALSLATSSDMHKAYAKLQDELNNALESLRNLESQRASQHQELVRNIAEIERLNNMSASQGGELATLKRELEAQRSVEEQQEEFLEQTRNEVEMLRSQLHVKEEECEQLQSNSTSGKPRSLNDEFVDSLRQQHALDLSAAQSQIRALEDSVFSAEAKAHALQKQVVFLEDQLRHGPRSFSPVSRPASRNETDLRRASFGSHRNTNLAPSSLARPIFDHELSPETVHKRKISLSMLKVRMESEMVPQPPSRALSPVQSAPGGSRPTTPTMEEVIHRRPQFLDDSHVFWCSSCRGDLVIL